MLNVIAASAAFTPGPQLNRAPAPSMVTASKSDFCYGLPGNIAPAGNFDPANLLEGTPKKEVYRWREAELTHGRVGMLAAAGFLVQEYWHPLFTADGGPAIEQIPGLPPALWFLMTLGIGIAETARIQAGWANPYESMDNIQSLKDDYYPGDLRFDPLGLKPDDPAELRAMQERELSHGRLGMLAAAGFMAQEAVTGQTWGEQDNAFTQFLLGGYFNQEAAELARDAAAGM
mmetsp:Transcript_54531/g.118909  ORF Transcript_54531/g.118909 Transcript_54531/m.118909 type:complete len:231 (-) Transcript_54531:167-859(-)